MRRRSRGNTAHHPPQLKRKLVLVQINGEQREFTGDSLRLSELIEELSLAPQRIAIEVNREIVRRALWEQAEVHDGDRVEIVHFVGGGHTAAMGAAS
jgi:thiamine biosynthesis protein ThiS